MFQENYQIPIHAKKGSIIFWDSRTIHSAKYPDKKENTWRSVFYISMRPVQTFDQANLDTIKNATINGTTTNHWGSVIFEPLDRLRDKNNKIVALYTNSNKLSIVNKMTLVQKKITGMEIQ